MSPSVNAFVSDDHESARDAMRRYSRSVGGMGCSRQTFNNALVQRYGFEDGARGSRISTWRSGKDEAAAALPAS